MAWLRIYDTLIDNPKVMRLKPELFRALVSLWCLAKRHNGKLPPIADIAFALREAESKVARWLANLEAAELIDKTDDGVLTPHDWETHQFVSDDVTARVRKHREKRKDEVSSAVPRNDDETFLETHQNRTEQNQNRTEQKEPRARRASVNADFARFYSAYPHKVGRAAADKAFAKAITKADLDAIMAGLERYIRTKPPDRPWCNPATWLNQERWADSEAPTSIAPNESGYVRKPYRPPPNTVNIEAFEEHLAQVERERAAS